MNTVRRRTRSKVGGMLLLAIVAIIAVTLVGLAFVLLGLDVTSRMKGTSAAEAAALAGAKELSRAVINDEYFGLIGLVDSPPLGTNPRSEDGEPLPVLSINSIIANARHELIVAKELNSDFMLRQARFECEQARRAARSLDEKLAGGLRPGGTVRLTDASGNSIDPYRKALEVFLANAGRNATAGGMDSGASADYMKFELSLGWMSNGGTTESVSPGARYCLANMCQGDRFKPGVDLSFAGESLYMAAVGGRPSLVVGDFKERDGVHPASIIRVNARFPSMSRNSPFIPVQNLAQPGGPQSRTPAGSFVIDLQGAEDVGINSLNELLAKLSDQSNAEVRAAYGGDYPGLGSTLVASGLRTGETRLSGRDALGMALFDWIRTARGNLQIDSLSRAFNEPFVKVNSSASRYCRFDIGNDGVVRVTLPEESPFPAPKVNENQLYCYIPGALNVGTGAMGIAVFDQVYSLGTVNGGRHAGNLVAGESVNWSELPLYSEPGEASILGRGSQSLGVVPSGQPSLVAEGGIRSETVTFNRLDGGTLSKQPRKTYLSGGLAVLIQIAESI